MMREFDVPYRGSVLPVALSLSSSHSRTKSSAYFRQQVDPSATTSNKPHSKMRPEQVPSANPVHASNGFGNLAVSALKTCSHCHGIAINHLVDVGNAHLCSEHFRQQTILQNGGGQQPITDDFRHSMGRKRRQST